jgi:hypothetical protein
MELSMELQVRIIEFCDFQTKMNLTATWKYFNKLIFRKLADNIHLRFCCFDEGEQDYKNHMMRKLNIMEMNARSYKKLTLFNADVALRSGMELELIKALKIVGKHVQQLGFYSERFTLGTLKKRFSQKLRRLRW